MKAFLWACRSNEALALQDAAVIGLKSTRLLGYSHNRIGISRRIIYLVLAEPL